VLNEFEKISSRPIHFDTIDKQFYDEFMSFMVKVKNYGPNNIGKHVSMLKDWLNEATKEGLNNNMAYKRKDFAALSMPGFAVYSNEAELMKVYDLDLSDNKRLERVRDLFIIGAFT